MAEEWWRKLATVVLPQYENKKAVCLSPYFRFYKYTPGQKFNMHKDGRQNIDDLTTYYTLLLYLNDDCTGGTTKFRQEGIEVSPKTGNALLFQHHLWHQGTEVMSGVKYVLRTDIAYQ
jgi:hypothetical protein